MVTSISVRSELYINIPLPKSAILPEMVTFVSVGLELNKYIPPPADAILLSASPPVMVILEIILLSQFSIIITLPSNSTIV